MQVNLGAQAHKLGIHMRRTRIHTGIMELEMVSGVPVWMFLVLKTPSAVLVGGRLTEYEKNICVLYPPMTPIVYEARGVDYHHEEWIQFLSVTSFIQVTWNVSLYIVCRRLSLKNTMSAILRTVQCGSRCITIFDMVFFRPSR